MKRGSPFTDKTWFHSVLKDKAIITGMVISGALEVLPAILKGPGVRTYGVYSGKFIRDFLPVLFQINAKVGRSLIIQSTYRLA